MSIELGKIKDGKPVRLDIERLVSTRMLLQANSGGRAAGVVSVILSGRGGRPSGGRPARTTPD